MNFAKLRLLVVSWLLIGGLATRAQDAILQPVISTTIAPDLRSTDITLRLGLSPFSRPAAIAPGNTVINVAYDPAVFDVSSLQVLARGDWDIRTTPTYFDSLTVTKGVGDFLVFRIKTKDVAPGPGIPNIGRGTINTLVATVRMNLRAVNLLCGKTYKLDYLRDSSTICLATRGYNMSITSFGQDENSQPLFRSVDYAFSTPVGQRLNPPILPTIVNDFTTSLTPAGGFNFNYTDRQIRADRRGLRYRVSFTPDPSFGCTTGPVTVDNFTKPSGNPADEITPARQVRFTYPFTCNGTVVNRGTVQVVTYNVCGDSAVSATFPVAYDACFPYVFQPGFSRTSLPALCAGDPVTVTIDSAQARNRRGTVIGSVSWARPAPPISTAQDWISYDGGRTWGRSLTATFNNLWATTAGNTATIKVLVRDRFLCVSDTHFVTIPLNKPVDPNTRAVIGNKASIPASICSDARQELVASSVGDALTYTWKVISGGGQLFDAPTGGNVVTSGSPVYYQKTPGFIGVARVALVNDCFGGLGDSANLNYITIPDAAVGYTAPDAGQPGAVAAGAPVTLRSLATGNGPGTVYRFAVTQNGTTTTGALSTATTKDTVFTQTGTVTVTLRAQSADGLCFDEKSTSFEVITKRILFVPTIFSPKAGVSERNATFRAYGEDISGSDFKMIVMNRWGQVVFESTNFQKAWDGKDPSGLECVVGTYAWALKGKYNDGTTFERTGIVNLVK